MKTTTITVSVRRTIQTEQYESSSVDITEIVELDEGDDADECRSELYAKVTKMTKRAIDNEFKKYMNSAAERKKAKAK